MLISVIRTLILYIFIVIALRIMGKRQLSDMQTSELVITLVISDIAAIPMQDNAIPMLSGIVPILVLMVLEIVLSIIMLKSPGIRSAVCGKPIIIIEKGKLLQSAMKKLRLSTEDLFAQLRLQEIFCIDDIDYCIAETNGQLSVLLKPAKQPLEAGSVKELNESGIIETVVINDGTFLENSMRICGISRKEAEDYTKQEGVPINDIFIMTATNRGDFRIITKEKD